MKDIRWKRAALAALAAAAFLSACGGSDNDDIPSNSAGITSVKVMGDSLSDGGTFQGIPGFGRIFR